MASAEFLEQALSTDVDQNAVNAIVGSLENQLVTSAPTVPLQNNIVNVFPSQLGSKTTSGNFNIGLVKFSADQSSSGVDSGNFQRPNVSYSVQGPVHSQSLSGSVSGPTEGLKVIYSQSQNFANPGNRVTFPTHSIANGCIGLSQNQIVVPQSANKIITMQPPLVIKQGTPTGQMSMQSGMVTVPMSVSSSIASSIPNMMINKQGAQNVVVTTQNIGGAQQQQPTLIPNVQIVNMRPGAPTIANQKSVATVSPRVVIGSPQVVGTRSAAPGITLQTLQSLQPGQQGHLLLKTENGQYQLLRVGPAPAGGGLTAPPAQAMRLSTVPAQPGLATVSTSLPTAPGVLPSAPSAPIAVPVAVAAPPAALPPMQAPNTNQQQQQQQQQQMKPSDNTKEKCRNFLANLLDLSSKEPKSVERNVRNLIQELIDSQVEPEQFCNRLERLLNASPQPCLIGFLKKSLPLLRQSLITKELVIEGINPPSAQVAYSSTPMSVPSPANVPQPQPTDEELSPELTPLLPPALPPMMPPFFAQAVAQPKNFNVISVHAPAPAPVQPKTSKPAIAVLQNIPVQTKINVGKMSSPKSMTVNSKNNFSRAGQSTPLSTVLTPGKIQGKSLLKEKEKKAAMQYAAQPFGDDKMAGDDDINDVAAMGGVNLAEESQRILGSTELIGTQIRSCKDEYLLPMGLVQARIKAVCAKHELDEPSLEVAGLISHAVHERLKNIVEKLAVVAQHRIDLVKTDSRYETTQDVKGQLKFLEELDRVDKKRREDSERELLLRAAKSRSKNEDPEQAKLKAKAKEMQRAELEELRQREANLTALQAIGPRKKARLDGPGGAGDSVSTSSANSSSGLTGRSQMALRTRLKRINQRDMLFLLEQEKDTAHSTLLYRSYLK